ncbi:MAG: hypothetical protein ACC726_12600, partial [Chloroflexota bacterium]
QPPNAHYPHPTPDDPSHAAETDEIVAEFEKAGLVEIYTNAVAECGLPPNTEGGAAGAVAGDGRGPGRSGRPARVAGGQRLRLRAHSAGVVWRSRRLAPKQEYAE